MRRYLNKIIQCICAALVFIIILFEINNGVEYKAAGITSDITANKNSVDSFDPALYKCGKVLAIWDSTDNISGKYVSNIREVLRVLGMELELQDIKDFCVNEENAAGLSEYDMVIVAFDHWDIDLYDYEYELMNYVKGGGNIFWGIIPDTCSRLFPSIYRHLGIVDRGTYENDEGMYFNEELIPSSKGMTFCGSGFDDITMSVKLEEKAVVFLSSAKNNNPLLWTYDYGEGCNIFFNGTSITGDYYTGLLAGCILTGLEEYIYPVINVKSIFIDDFPSKQYETDSKIIKEEFNRTAKEFYRDIWWPSMQSAATRYDYVYTGLLVLTYDDEVKPENFFYEKDTMEQYYGNSLLKSGAEIGVHGYNHQSLTFEGGTPAELGYNSWNSKEDMASSIMYVVEHMKKMFPNVIPQTYVPPSNYLSNEGREAIKEAMPNLKVISGVYTNESESGEVYARKFGVSEDGIVEFPRITSGMLNSTYEKFAALGACGLYGVYSHFIHPDDVLDEERGNGNTWEVLFDNFCKQLSFINENFTKLRPMTASDAADEVVMWNELKVNAVYDGSTVEVKLNNFYGEAYFYLRSKRGVKTGSFRDYDAQLINEGTGRYYYFIKGKAPVFNIELEGD